MNETTIKIHGRIPSKKNSMVHIVRHGAMLKFPSKDYQAREKDAISQMIAIQLPKCKANAVIIGYEFTRPDNRIADISNKIESVNDMLVKYGFLEDDRWQYLEIAYARSTGIDPENAGVTLHLTYHRHDNIQIKSNHRKSTRTGSPTQQELFVDMGLA